MLTATTDPRELLGTDDTRYLIVATLTRLRHLPVVRNRWEDVLQEAYLALAQALPQFDPARSCWATFLATVITNHVRDLCWRWLPLYVPPCAGRRAHLREKAVLAGRPMKGLAALAQGVAPAGPDPADREALAWARSKLAPRDQGILDGYYLQNQTYDELGRTYGLTRQGVGWRIQKILGELRELLTGSGGFTDCSLEN